MFLQDVGEEKHIQYLINIWFFLQKTYEFLAEKDPLPPPCGYFPNIRKCN